MIGLSQSIDGEPDGLGGKNRREVVCTGDGGARARRVQFLIINVLPPARRFPSSYSHNDFPVVPPGRQRRLDGPTVVGKRVASPLPPARHVLSRAVGELKLNLETAPTRVHRLGESQIDQNRAGFRKSRRARNLHE